MSLQSNPSRKSHVLAPIFPRRKERTGHFRVVLLYFDIPHVSVSYMSLAHIYITNDHETKSARHRLLTRGNVIIIFALSCLCPRAQTTMIRARFYRDYLADHRMLTRRSSKSILRDFRANQTCLLKRYRQLLVWIVTCPHISLGYVIKYIFTNIKLILIYIIR